MFIVCVCFCFCCLESKLSDKQRERERRVKKDDAIFSLFFIYVTFFMIQRHSREDADRKKDE
jgi:hypothetical protein